MKCRKNQATLSDTEKKDFVNAVLKLKKNGIYDQYVQVHANMMLNDMTQGTVHYGHNGPGFFPWHREFLRRFELELQMINPLVTLPYWNWTVDNSDTSSLWDDNFLGGNGSIGKEPKTPDGQVLTGPFAFDNGKWPLTIGDTQFLQRSFRQDPGAPTLPFPADLNAALQQNVYDEKPWDRSPNTGFRNIMEGWKPVLPGLHNRVHRWVGGSMGPGSSPNDPVFWLHHCFIDKCWMDWQNLHPKQGYLPDVPTAGILSPDDPMEPWLSQGQIVTPDSLWSHHQLAYSYDTEELCDPTVTAINPTRGSAAGGDTVTITGTGFIGVTGVSFDKMIPATLVSEDSDTQITIISPARFATTDSIVPVIVYTPMGSSTVGNVGEVGWFTYI
jgi:tyrosinase